MLMYFFITWETYFLGHLSDLPTRSKAQVLRDKMRMTHLVIKLLDPEQSKELPVNSSPVTMYYP